MGACTQGKHAHEPLTLCDLPSPERDMLVGLVRSLLAKPGAQELRDLEQMHRQSCQAQRIAGAALAHAAASTKRNI